MATTLFQIKRSTTSGVTPNTTDPANTSYIVDGELAINLPDGRLFSSNGSVLIEIGANLTSLNVVGNVNANSSLSVLNTLRAGSNTFFANSSVVKITVNDTLTFADSTTQNTAFRVYDSSGTRIA